MSDLLAYIAMAVITVIGITVLMKNKKKYAVNFRSEKESPGQPGLSYGIVYRISCAGIPESGARDNTAPAGRNRRASPPDRQSRPRPGCS